MNELYKYIQIQSPLYGGTVGFYYPYPEEDVKIDVDQYFRLESMSNFFNQDLKLTVRGEKHIFGCNEAAFQGLKYLRNIKQFTKENYSTSNYANVTKPDHYGKYAFELKKTLKNPDYRFANWANILEPSVDDNISLYDNLKHLNSFKLFETYIYDHLPNNFKAMFKLLLYKINNNKRLQNILLHSNHILIIEHNNTYNRDAIWSNSRDGNGANILGLLYIIISAIMNDNLYRTLNFSLILLSYNGRDNADERIEKRHLALLPQNRTDDELLSILSQISRGLVNKELIDLSILKKWKNYWVQDIQETTKVFLDHVYIKKNIQSYKVYYIDNTTSSDVDKIIKHINTKYDNYIKNTEYYESRPDNIDLNIYLNIIINKNIEYKCMQINKPYLLIPYTYESNNSIIYIKKIKFRNESKDNSFNNNDTVFIIINNLLKYGINIDNVINTNKGWTIFLDKDTSENPEDLILNICKKCIYDNSKKEITLLH
jgi:hypothetical protein